MLYPVELRALNPSESTEFFVLTEGRNRQIRRMCELVGLHVTDLFRTRIGPLELGDLPEGRWRRLSDQEREALIRASAARPGGQPSRRGPASPQGSSG